MPDPPTSRSPEPDPLRPDALETGPGGWSRQAALRDGTRVLLRQIRPSDRDHLVEGLARLSAASRYLRFRSTADRLTETQLDELTRVDHHDHDAIVAIAVGHTDRPGIGVARFIREPYEPDVAEAAITVADEYHGLGAATILLGALASRARDEGVTAFRSYVLDGNLGMLEVLDHLGASRVRESDGTWRVHLAVPDDDSEVPASDAGRAFLEVAREEGQPPGALPSIWSRWRRGHAPPASGDDGDADVPADAELREQLDDWLRHRYER